MRDQFHHHNTDMARKPSLSIEALVALGPEKLAQLVLDEAGRSPSFRRLADAALAGAKGPDAVAKLIDRRLAALEKARGFIEWDKVRAFRDDLHATVATIAGELAQGSVAMAIDRLLGSSPRMRPCSNVSMIPRVISRGFIIMRSRPRII